MSTGHDLLSAPVRARFMRLAHAGDLLPEPCRQPVVGEAGAEGLGTRVRFQFDVQDGRVRSIRFRAYGCPWTLATCEWLAERLEGREWPVTGLGEPTDWAAALTIPLERLGRLLVVEDALKAALGAGSTHEKPRSHV